MEDKGPDSDRMDEGRIRALIEGLIEEWPDVPPEDRLKLAEKFPEAFALSGLTMEEPPYVEPPLADEEEDEEVPGEYLDELEVPLKISPEEFAKRESDRFRELYRNSWDVSRKEEDRQLFNRYLASIGGTPIEADPPETEEEARARRREETIASMVRTFQKDWPRWSQRARARISGIHPEVIARAGLSLDDPYEEG